MNSQEWQLRLDEAEKKYGLVEPKNFDAIMCNRALGAYKGMCEFLVMDLKSQEEETERQKLKLQRLRAVATLPNTNAAQEEWRHDYGSYRTSDSRA